MKKQILGIAAGLALLVPTSAKADLICATGSVSYYACASIAVSFVDAGNGTGSIFVKVANLDAWSNNTFTGTAVDGYRLTGFGIVGSPTLIGTVTGMSSTIDYSNATALVGAYNQWTAQIDASFSSIYVEAGATSNGANGGILGCLPDGGPADYSQTCGAGSYIGFTFTTNKTLAQLQALYPANNFGYGMRGQSGNTAGQESYRCDDDPSTNNNPPCLVTRTTITEETVPEPITMVLLGTGLVGLGAARRRKKNGDVASE